MSYTRNDLNNAIQSFQNGIVVSNQKTFNDKNIDIKNAVLDAVRLAYNDAKRTMSGIGGKKNNENKEEALGQIAKELQDYLEDSYKNTKEDFDEFHDSLCAIWCNAFPNSDLGTYGKAQKIVNMSFKYLFCDDAIRTEKEEHFQFCHMPLDSFTLEWFKRNFTCELQLSAGKITSWSNLEKGDNNSSDYFTKGDKYYYSYNFFSNNIRRHVNEKETKLHSPLELEFIVWPQIQKELAAENFLFGLEDFSKKSRKRKKDIRDMELGEKYKTILKILKSKGY